MKFEKCIASCKFYNVFGLSGRTTRRMSRSADLTPANMQKG